MSRPLMSPDGSRIKGTLERLTAVAVVAPDTLVRDADGKVTYEYSGGTEVNWDSQVTLTGRGPTKQPEIVFVDEDGTQWLANELVEVPAEEDEDGVS